MAQTMRLFSKFPSEVRLKIWQNAMPPPRVVRLNQPTKKRSGSKDNLVLLFVNKESRDEVLRRYEKLSGDDDIYVDFSQDIIFIDTSFLKDEVERPRHPVIYINEPQIQKDEIEWPGHHILYVSEPRIQILAVEYQFWIWKSHRVYHIASQCSKLRKLVIIIPKDKVDITTPVTFQDLGPDNHEIFGSTIDEIIQDVWELKQWLNVVIKIPPKIVIYCAA
jgi:hypothetical protein